ncbi:MAG: hypothetical protein QOI95_709 [Acidimicrobiaceae bacterium]|jgi:hypothetical protein
MPESKSRDEGGGDLGTVRLDAMVDPSNDSAVAFWQAVGFEVEVDDGRFCCEPLTTCPQSAGR